MAARIKEAAMKSTHAAKQEVPVAPKPAHEAADWDEEDLGLTWDESEAQRLADELTARRPGEG
jgi:hypothetical protein